MSRAKPVSERNPYDFYATPEWCYEQLDFPFHLFETAHEPCRGDGRIVTFLENKGLTVTSTEIREGEVELAPAVAGDLVMLLRINFLGSKKRYNFWKKNPAAAIYVLTKRPSFTGKGTDATEYAWFVWQKKEYIKPGIHHMKPPNLKKV